MISGPAGPYWIWPKVDHGLDTKGMFGCLSLELHVTLTTVNNNSVVYFDVIGVTYSANLNS